MNAEEWLDKYSYQLPPEELSFEEEKINSIEIWPIPVIVPNIGHFVNINTQDEFNKIVSDLNNIEIILKRNDLFEEWILPKAILLFSKVWFDGIKYKSTITSNIPFPLFSDSDKLYAEESNISLEQTSKGRSIIEIIIHKTSYALRRYLEIKLESKKINNNENPGGYIIRTIKNELSKQIGIDLGFSLVTVVYCPLCVSGIKGSKCKTKVIEYGSDKFSCPKCKNDAIQLEVSNNKQLLEIVKKFELFSKKSCVCINDNCTGKFIPISLIDGICIESCKTYSDIQSFNKLSNINNIVVNCPYCNVNFTFEEAFSRKSGYKSKSGYITGLPKMKIWKNRDMELDISNYHSIFVDDRSVDPNSMISLKQKFNILIGELLIKMYNVKRNSISGLTLWFFYKAVFEWVTLYWEEAVQYFFYCRSYNRKLTLKEKQKYPEINTKKITLVIKGKEVPIHRYIFQTWISLLEKNISEFKIYGSISKLEDFPWFCRKPKFSGGPKSIFNSIVKDGKILNNSNIVSINKNEPKPRLAKIYSIHKLNNSYDFKNDIQDCEWNFISIKSNSSLCNNDMVKVKALMLPGHSSHTPIQKIIRFRSSMLNNVINRVLDEEETGKRDIEFWKNWEYNVRIAKENLFKGELNGR